MRIGNLNLYKMGTTIYYIHNNEIIKGRVSTNSGDGMHNIFFEKEIAIDDYYNRNLVDNKPFKSDHGNVHFDDLYTNIRDAKINLILENRGYCGQ